MHGGGGHETPAFRGSHNAFVATPNMESHNIPPSLHNLDSTVVLERGDSSASSVAYLRQATASPSTRDHNTDTDDDTSNDVECGDVGAPLAPIGLDVSIRFGRLGLIMAVAVAVLATFTLTFKTGVELTHFNPAEKDADAQKKLIDDYNSYTGNFASAFGRPIEIFVALAAHVVLLRAMKAALLRTEVSWKTDLLTLGITMGVGFLITNGLNALNVQPQPPEIRSIISGVDLCRTLPVIARRQVD